MLKALVENSLIIDSVVRKYSDLTDELFLLRRLKEAFVYQRDLLLPDIGYRRELRELELGSLAFPFIGSD